MMRLLHAELRKLHRPLLWCCALGFVVFILFLAVGGASNAEEYVRPAAIPSCTAMHLPADVSCAEAERTERLRDRQAQPARLASARHAAERLSPSGAGAEAAGLMASLPGVLVVSLLVGGHVGAEWSGHTLKSLLTQCGHRGQVLAAKWASVWLASVAVMAAGWVVFAVAGPIAAHAYGLPAAHASLTHSIGQFCRAGLVLAVITSVGLLASVLTRSAVGALGTCSGVFLGLLATASLPGLGRWTPATWVQNWMGFGAGQQSITTVPDNFWSRFFDASGNTPTHLVIDVEGAALAGLAAACMVSAVVVFRRSDILG
ncbi:ABC transporter permease [Streptomyces sp. NPDC005708]|uniref:ABC transporter permease n=1 Tax=Streptomyces sp. NPDC005708 TaxID=3154564 RepID=UPI0033C4E501